MSQFSRGDVLMVQLDPTKGSEQAGAHPVIIVSRDSINRIAINNNPKRSLVMVCIPTTGRENLDQLYPCHVELKKGTGGLTKDSVALCEQIRAIAPGERLIRHMGKLDAKEMAKIEEALRITLALDTE